MNAKQLRTRVLAEWRGLPQSFERPDRAVACGVAVQQIMKELGLADRLRSEEMRAAWREVVGEFVANHSSPHQLKDGVLYVSVLQPTVHFELDRVWKRDILDKMKKRFGSRTVREIKFRLG